MPADQKLLLPRTIDCAPYLLSLGLTKSLMSLVWNVGPISGMICQPIVGVVADRSTSRYGGSWVRERMVLLLLWGEC